MLYRALSQLLRIMVEPELTARLNDGRLRREDLPVQVQLLRMVWGASPEPDAMRRHASAESARLSAAISRARSVTSAHALPEASARPDPRLHRTRLDEEH